MSVRLQLHLSEYADAVGQRLAAWGHDDILARVWAGDHTVWSAEPVPELLDPQRVTRINRTMWTRLKGMDEESLKEAVGSWLDGEELMCLARRRELLIEHVEALVAERGEGVFY